MRQAGALPVLGAGAAARIVLITSRETRRWVIPKGWIEPGEAAAHAAAREAAEEAGLAGEVEAIRLGLFVYAKRTARAGIVPCEVVVHRFRVARLLPDWPERRERDRRLFTPAAAAALVEEEGLARLLLDLARR